MKSRAFLYICVIFSISYSLSTFVLFHTFSFLFSILSHSSLIFVLFFLSLFIVVIPPSNFFKVFFRNLNFNETLSHYGNVKNLLVESLATFDEHYFESEEEDDVIDRSLNFWGTEKKSLLEIINTGSKEENKGLKLVDNLV